MGGGDRLVRGLTSSNGVVEAMAGVSHQEGACGGGAGNGQEGEADKGLKWENFTLRHLTFLNISHCQNFNIEIKYKDLQRSKLSGALKKIKSYYRKGFLTFMLLGLVYLID